MSLPFWKPGSAAPGLVDRAAEGETPVLIHNSNDNLSIAQQRCRLPIFSRRKEILYLVENYPTIVIVGETGCGKTTQIPQYLDEAGWTKGGRVVCCTQPRRVAATSVAQRVADETGSMLGSEVGYTIRFDDMSSEMTRIRYMTDGILIREAMLDPLLSRYSVIMLDEAHERSLPTDILLGMLKKIQKKRKDLRVIIASATVDAESFHAFFNTNKTKNASQDTARIISVEGRVYPVHLFYLAKPCRDYLAEALETVMKIHLNKPQGHVLVFMTGQVEIDTLVSLLKDRAHQLPKDALNMRILPLYANLSQDDQMKVFKGTPKHTRKIIVATNIAETSITIEGIVYVVDPGFVKIRSYNPRTGMEQLIIVPISQAQAKQRSGRAGRLRGGVAFRLYTEAHFYKLLREDTPPEIQRQNLASVILQLKALGIDDVLHFDFMSPPPSEYLIRALELLYSLGALDDAGKLTPDLGMTMAEFPLDPMLSKMMLSSAEFGCSEEICSIAAILSVPSVFLNVRNYKRDAEKAKRAFSVYEGDHLTYLNVYNAFVANGLNKGWCNDNFLNYRNIARAVAVRTQLAKLLKRHKRKMISCNGDVDKIRRCIVSGYFAHAAVLTPSGQYRTVRDNQMIMMHPSSVLFSTAAPWVVYHEVLLTSECYMRDVITIEPLWLSELAPHFYEYIEKKTGGNAPGPPPKKIARR